MNHARRVRIALVAGLSLASACSNDTTTNTITTITTTGGDSAMPTTSTTPERSVPPISGREHRVVDAAGTTFAVGLQGEGSPVLVIHGAGEDATMLEPFAAQLAEKGHRVITYDRRGTGASGRDDWPGSGAGQHADDAAALLSALDIASAQIVGLSSGGVIALDLAVRHPEVVTDAFVWEAPAVGAVPDGEVITRQFMAPVEAHLDAHPGDFVGAQAILLSALAGVPVAVDNPLFAA
ncbi:MAG: alpha/beta hydrolase, partial [Actinobacteria bacterium]|nr:alpha/beta hydrolase [Actinomycetota bacterium]